jgi:hypothetical protein
MIIVEVHDFRVEIEECHAITTNVQQNVSRTGNQPSESICLNSRLFIRKK